jgi:hypothetical protein
MTLRIRKTTVNLHHKLCFDSTSYEYYLNAIKGGAQIVFTQRLDSLPLNWGTILAWLSSSACLSFEPGIFLSLFQTYPCESGS